MKNVDAFLKQLQADGLTTIFGNPGSSEEDILDVLSNPEFSNIKYYLGYQEGSVVAMADAYARARQTPAIVQLHSYAGLANGLGMMYYARRGYTPMVVFAGEAGVDYEALDGQMAANLVDMARPFVKCDQGGPCAWRTTDGQSVLRLLRRAIKAAATPPCGPVFLALPMDVLNEECTEEVIPCVEKGLTVDSLLPWRRRSVDSRVTPDASVIRLAAEKLVAAQKLIFIVGDGIASSGAQQELTELARLLGAAVWGGNYSEVNMPASNPCFQGSFGHMFGEDSKKITSQADVVLVVGTTLLPEVFPALNGVFAPGAFVMHFDLNSYEIAKNFPAQLAALADPKPTLRLLADQVGALQTKEQIDRAAKLVKEMAAAKARAHAENVARDEKHPLSPTGVMYASTFFRALASALPKDAMIFDEALTHSDELTRYIPQDVPGCYFQTRVGMLGTGLPGAVGLKAAFPQRVVFGFVGDGSSMSTLQAISTAARHHLGVKFVICNNHSYRILKLNLLHRWGELKLSGRPLPVEFDLHSPACRFDLLAEGQGVRAIRVEKLGDMEKAIELALADDEPLVIDLVIDGSV